MMKLTIKSNIMQPFRCNLSFTYYRPFLHRPCLNHQLNCSQKISTLIFSLTKSKIILPATLHLSPLQLVCHRHYSSSKDFSNKPPGTVNIPWWGRLLIVTSIGAALVYTYKSAEHEKELESEMYRYKEFEKISLGGDWMLVDHHGNRRSSTDFRGHWIIMYMGFTHCPDICPEEMEKLGKIVKNFDEDPKLPKLQPLFITLDPERDSPSVIKDYLRDFPSPRIVGFTGTEEEIRDVAKKFRAYFGKGPRDEDNDYIVDHTIIIYLINPKGEFVNYYNRSRTANEIIKSVTKHIAKYNELQK